MTTLMFVITWILSGFITFLILEIWIAKKHLTYGILLYSFIVGMCTGYFAVISFIFVSFLALLIYICNYISDSKFCNKRVFKPREKTFMEELSIIIKNGRK